jgi:hypothetical protein
MIIGMHKFTTHCLIKVFRGAAYQSAPKHDYPDIAEGLFLHGQISLYILMRCIHALMPEPQGDDVEG